MTGMLSAYHTRVRRIEGFLTSIKRERVCVRVWGLDEDVTLPKGRLVNLTGTHGEGAETGDLVVCLKAQGKVLAEFMACWSRVSAICGALGSGKTIQTCAKLFLAMCNQSANAKGIRPTRFYAIRNTYHDLTTTTIKDWLSLFGDLGRYKEGNKVPPTHTLDFMLEDGTRVMSELVFIALDRPNSIKKLRGSQLTGVWLNEMKELSKPVVDMADLRHGRYPSMASGGVQCTWNGMIGDTNAPDKDHWYYDLAEVDTPQDWTFFKQPGGLIKEGDIYRPNPDAENLGNLKGGVMYYVVGQQGKSKDWINVNLCNEYGFVQDGKPVYPEYVDTVHCLAEVYTPDPKLPLALGFDFGRTPAATIAQFLPNIERWVIFDEYVTEDMSAASFAPSFKRYLERHYPTFKFARSYGDPSGDFRNQSSDDTPMMILRANGIHCQPTLTNDPLVRNAAVVNPLVRLCMDGKPALMISPNCKVLRQAFKGKYCYRRIKVADDERYQDTPVKNAHSHVIESAQYLLCGNGEGAKALKRKDSSFTNSVVAQTGFNVFD